jgi:hypothetical protein
MNLRDRLSLRPYVIVHPDVLTGSSALHVRSMFPGRFSTILRAAQGRDTLVRASSYWMLFHEGNCQEEEDGDIT